MADWAGQFGNDYTDRNSEIPRRDEFWAKILPKGIHGVHEIGCNVGTNLEAIRRIRKDVLTITGVDVNENAVKVARQRGLNVTLPPPETATFCKADFVFTVGVLIHLRTPELITMLRKMYQSTFRYVFFAEYFSPYDVEVPYHGERGALFKRDFGKIFETLLPNAVTLVDSGQAGKDLGFDNTHWWLYDVSNSPS
jgi:pseudaminic acid biosynthesis-associated methylase